MGWLSGYNKRIKLTIDHTKIDDTLSNFPVTVFFTDAQAEEIFAEFDADEDFDRGQFALGDDTLLYAEKELFDHSESKAIYHVKIPSISSSVDTDYYFYYDNDADHNTTYIGAIGTTAGENVWDSNFKAVYHMADTDFDIINDCDTLTDWSVNNGTQSIDTSDKHSGTGSLKLITDAEVGEGYVTYYPAGTWDWSTKTHLKVWMKGDTAESGQLYVFDVSNNWEYWDFTYPTSWTLVSFDLSAPDGDDGTGCGDWSDINAIRFDINAAEKTARYDEIRLYPGNNTIIQDSTSNNNDCTKEAANEPIETTGKVGLAQDFDGSDDGITLPTINPQSLITEEVVLNPDAFLEADEGKNTVLFLNAGTYMQIRGDTGNVGKFAIALHYGESGDTGYQYSTNALSAETPAYLGYVYDGSSLKGYINDTEEISVADLSGDIRYATLHYSMGFEYSSSKFRFMDGKISEVRISDINRAVAWLKGTKNTLWDTLLTYGSEETEEEEEDNAIFFGFNF